MPSFWEKKKNTGTDLSIYIYSKPQGWMHRVHANPSLNAAVSSTFHAKTGLGLWKKTCICCCIFNNSVAYLSPCQSVFRDISLSIAPAPPDWSHRAALSIWTGCLCSEPQQDKDQDKYQGRTHTHELWAAFPLNISSAARLHWKPTQSHVQRFHPWPLQLRLHQTHQRQQQQWEW